MKIQEYNIWKSMLSTETFTNLKDRFTHHHFFMEFRNLERKYEVIVQTDRKYEDGKITGGHCFIDYNERPFRWLTKKVKEGKVTREKINAIWYYTKV